MPLMSGSTSRESHGAVLVTLALLVSVAGLAWAGVRTGHVGIGDAPSVQAQEATATATARATAAPTPSVTPTQSPTLAVIPPGAELVGAFEALTAELGGEYALAWVDAHGLSRLGGPGDGSAWSTIKVPLAIAAAEHASDAGGNPWPDIEAAITRSDNDAAARLWASLGPPEDAAAAVDEVLSAYDSGGTQTQSVVVRPPFSSFGQTEWAPVDQARFAAALSCADRASVAAQVRAAMGRVAPDHRWGIGRLQDAHIKSGWGPDAAGAYTLRQLGDGSVEGRRYALAVVGRAADGTYPQAAADLDELVDWWAQAAAHRPGLPCTEGR